MTAVHSTPDSFDDEFSITVNSDDDDGFPVPLSAAEEKERCWSKCIDDWRCKECGSGPLYVRTLTLYDGLYHQFVCPHHSHIIGTGANRCDWVREEKVALSH